MKKIFKMLAIPVFLLAFAGCSQDTLEDINFNKNNPADVAGRLLLTDAITASAFTMTSTDLAFYASVYIEYHTGVHGQMNAAEIRGGEPSNATTYNNQWNSGYRNLYNLKTIINKTSEGGAEAGNYHLLGMAQVLTAYNWAIMTDLFGDIPFTEALQPGVIFQPKIDKQEVIYTEIFSLLDEAIANFGKTSTFASPGTQDLLYKGDVAKWTKFAQGLKARYTTRLALKNAQWAKVIEYANASFATKAEEAAYQYNGTTSLNPFAKIITDRSFLGASASLNNKLTTANDPRKDIFWRKNPSPSATTVVFATAGSTEISQTKFGVSALSTTSTPTFMLSLHEVEFLKAEAHVRLEQPTEAWTALQKAVRAAFVKVKLHDTLATNYLEDQVKPRFDVEPLKEVMFQKYIAFFEEEAVEAYNDIIRLKALGNGTLINLEHPRPNEFPLRYTYGANDVTTNPNVFDAYGDGSYVYSEKVWWAGGTR